MSNIKYAKAIEAIIKFKKIFDNINPIISRKLLGEIGEFYVLRELDRHGFDLEHKGGQSGYDIYIKNINKRIEVKTSLLKNEGEYPNRNRIKFWGWKVENKNQKKRNKFDYLVCVALDNSFLKPKFYIFTHEQAFNVGDIPTGYKGRFNNIKKKIHLFKNKRIYEEALKSEKSKLITPYEEKINQRQSQFLNKWKKIKK